MNENRRPFVLFAHDNRYYSDPIKDQLAQTPDLNVKFCEDVSQVLCHFGADITKPDIFITDSRLSHGNELSDKATQGGLTAGTASYELIRIRNPKLPVVIFTTNHDEHESLRSLNDPHLVVIKAKDSMGSDIMDAIRGLVPAIIKQGNGLFPDGWGQQPAPAGVGGGYTCRV